MRKATPIWPSCPVGSVWGRYEISPTVKELFERIMAQATEVANKFN